MHFLLTFAKLKDLVLCRVKTLVSLCLFLVPDLGNDGLVQAQILDFGLDALKKLYKLRFKNFSLDILANGCALTILATVEGILFPASACRETPRQRFVASATADKMTQRERWVIPLARGNGGLPAR
ncbi:MAG TPA: hypothetical protein VI636_02220 [Candidatus Angelobacter sp.]